jgi:tetratricopeptide (TPR) repeat protein
MTKMHCYKRRYFKVISVVLFLSMPTGCADVRLMKKANLLDAAWKASMNGNHDVTISLYTKCLKLDPKDGMVYTCRANALYEKGDYDRAIDDYTKAVELNKSMYFLIHSYTGRGRCWYKKGQYRQAIINYDRALQHDFNQLLHTNKKALSQDLYLQRSLAYEKLGRFDMAKKDAERAYDIAPGNAEARRRKEEIRKILQQQGAFSGRSHGFDIDNVTVKPSIVYAGSRFDLIIEYSVFDTSMKTDEISLLLTYRILKDGAVIFTGKPTQVPFVRGKSRSWMVHLTASNRKGKYGIEVILEYKNKMKGQFVDFKIE